MDGSLAAVTHMQVNLCCESLSHDRMSAEESMYGLEQESLFGLRLYTLFLAVSSFSHCEPDTMTIRRPLG
jgi:hypothetical protein